MVRSIKLIGRMYFALSRASGMAAMTTILHTCRLLNYRLPLSARVVSDEDVNPFFRLFTAVWGGFNPFSEALRL